MITGELIDTLVRDLEPAPRGWVGRRMALGVLPGCAVSAAIVFSDWGPRPDLAAAVVTWPFLAKLGFTVALAAAATNGAVHLARPGGRAPKALALALVTITALAGLAVLQYSLAPREAHRALVMGGTAAVCPWLIMGLAVPIFAGASWAMAGMAPTRLGRAGTALGAMAGALSAFLYGLSCDEGGLAFVVLWYGLGIAVPTLVGGVLGRRLFRW